ncbi:MAG: hypothetical protein AB7S38_33375 [Vulcanimicrobiota bacterium]
MIRLSVDSGLVNGLLARIPDHQLRYEQGCLVGHFKLPVGAATAVIVPACRDSELVFSIPFSQIRGDLTGRFLLSKLTSALWGTISQRIERAVRPVLLRQGLPANTVRLDRRRERDGDVGEVVVCLSSLNRWLAGRHPRLRLGVAGVHFHPAGLELLAEVSH